MANEKISSFTTRTYAQLSNAALAAIPVVDANDNYSIVVNELFANFTNDGAGAGVYKSKSGNAVTLRSIAAGSSKVSVTESVSTIDVDVTEANLTHDNIGGILGLAKGGTGAALADPNADQILFWDDSDGAMEFLGLSSKLSITGNTMTVAEANIDLANCDNTNAQYFKNGNDTLQTGGIFVAAPSTVEIGSASVENNPDGTHVVEVSINGTLFKLLAILG